MEIINRIFLIVLDGFGVGALQDAKSYKDEFADTLTHLFQSTPYFSLPNLAKLGLYNLINSDKKPVCNEIVGCWGKMAESSKGKDTTTGHWEFTGIIIHEAFPTYPNGFPKEIIEEFERRIGKKTLGNIPASGTEIIQMLGEEHLKTGYPIVYTSADSVFQIAAHEEIIPLEKLYEYCQIAREMLGNPPFEKHKVARVIARPFVGTNKDNFRRTEHRRDFSIKPQNKTLLNYMKDAGFEVVAIGKIEDIFAFEGITKSIHTTNNVSTIQAILEITFSSVSKKTLVFANLIDFDTLWGHRRLPKEYYEALKYFDEQLKQILINLKEDDLLIITSDHGNDPTYNLHTDHTREYVPILVFSKNRFFKNNINLGIRKTFADIAKTIDEIFELGKIKEGESFLKDIFKI